MSPALHPVRAGRRFAGGLAAATFLLLAAAVEFSAAGDAFSEAGGEWLRPASEDELREALVGLAERRFAADGLHVDAARARLTLSRPLHFDEPLEAVPLWRAGPRPVTLPLRFALRREGGEAVHAVLAAPLQADAWTVERRVERGDPIACSDLRAIRRSRTAVPADALGTPCRLAPGAVALRRLSPSDVLRAGDAGERPAVRADDTLQLRVSHGAETLQARAVALSDGRLGETVRVRVPGRPAPFRARVTAHGAATLVEDGR
jgi:flagella basal body P-ring formation protein FlgA